MILSQLNDQIRTLDAQIVRRGREDETARRLMTIPGIGPLIATALVALANKMARIVWAIMAKGGIYKAPVAAA